MRFSTQIKPISYVKAHAAELLDRVNEEREPIIITQNGEARAVLLDIHSYEEAQETMALLHILVIGNKEIEAGKTYPIKEVTVIRNEFTPPRILGMWIKNQDSGSRRRK